MYYYKCIIDVCLLSLMTLRIKLPAIKAAESALLSQVYVSG